MVDLYKTTTKGFSLIELTMGMTVLGGLLIVIFQMNRQFNDRYRQIVTLGKVEDVRAYVRETMSCENTFSSGNKLSLLTECDNSQNINIMDSQSNTFISESGTSSLSLVKLRANCTRDENLVTLNISREISGENASILGSVGWSPLFRVPLVCNAIKHEVTQITAGRDHTCAIVGGAALCWGGNQHGQLGDGTNISRWLPTPVTGLNEGVEKIVAGKFFTCAIQNGKAKCWGEGPMGQIGNGGTVDRNTPQNVEGLTSDVSFIAAGREFACAIRLGRAYCWGMNDKYQLGSGTLGNSAVPVEVNAFQPAMVAGAFSKISGGYNHACAINDDAVFCWGSGYSHRLGNGSLGLQVLPASVTGMAGGITDLSVGYYYSCAIQANQLKCWGGANYNHGQLGVGDSSVRQTPTVVNGCANPSRVEASGYEFEHTCARCDGALKCWGNHNYGQIGDGTLANFNDNLPGNNRATPTQIRDDANNITMTTNVSDFTSGWYHTCAIHQGEIKCWGHGKFGRLGGGNEVNTVTPKAVTVPEYRVEAAKFLVDTP